MKTLKLNLRLLFGATLLISSSAIAQLPKLATLNLDAKGIILEPSQLGSLARIEADKTALFRVIDNYEIQSIAEKNKIALNECYSKSCISEIARLAGADKALSGSVERFGEKLVVTLRIVNAKNGEVEKTQSSEFLNIQPEIQQMIAITLNTMLGKTNNQEMVDRLTRKDVYDNSINNPGNNTLSLAGPRMGVTAVFGENGKRLAASKNDGGYDAYPVMSQFGYQFETQYLNSGNFQALAEFIPMVTGIDQGYFIPSLTILNGFRNTKSGWEFAFGPAFGLVRTANGYFENGTWKLESEWTSPTKNPNNIIERYDRRGDLKFSTGFVIAIGKTFKSGNLNIPFNAYVIPSKEGTRIGLSFGFNSK